MFRPIKTFENRYQGKIEPFKIIGNVYFVGCYPASSHLIDTGDGLILIDTGYFDTLHLLIDSIYKLGFSPYDVKYIIHTHWHYDHTEATKAFVNLYGSKTFIGVKDSAKTVTVDGEPVSLTPMEYGILKLLMEHPGTVFSTKVIYETVWQETALGNESSVAVHIRHLREKIEINPSEPRYLKVVWGQGYKMEDKP